MATEVFCYNKGCGNKFDPSSNSDDACTHHPGGPIFHDALKGWSCCKRRTTDFSDFLNIPGCSKGPHNSEKPTQPVAPKITSSKNLPDKLAPEIVRVTPKPIRPDEPSLRPSATEAKMPLSIKTTPSLQRALEKLTLQTNNESDVDKQIRVCKHLSCNVTYAKEINETCIYHSGTPVFHEGLKYWSCCQKKTTDFTSFMAQGGCVTGEHEWKVKSLAEAAPCRYDWHQTGSVVVISIFAKNTVGENSSVKVNQVSTEIDLEFEGGKRNFQLDLELDGVIDPSKSFVTLYGTKAEITFKKGNARHWKALNIPKVIPKEENDTNQDATQQNQEKNGDSAKNDEDDDSDFSGIDDVEFD